MQEVEYSSVVEAAQPIWPEDMSHTVQNPPDEDVDASTSWGRYYLCLCLWQNFRVGEREGGSEGGREGVSE